MGLPSEYYIPCECLLNEKFLQKLGPKIFNQRKLKKSKFINKVNENLFIHSSEEKFLPHLRYVVIKQGLDFSFSTMNDSQYLRIYLGDDPDFKDLSSWQKPFLVFFMGHVGYKNKALPGMIVELVNVRLYKGFITWIHYPDRFWGPGCIEYSDEVKDLIEQNFTQINMGVSQERNSSQTEHKDQMNDKLLNGFK